MDRSIRYVREHKVAPLLNDMLTHLLLSQASDPIDALIAFLEKRYEKNSRAQSSPPKAIVDGSGGRADNVPPSSTAVAAAPSVDAASSNATTTDGSATVLTAEELDDNSVHELVAALLRGEHEAQVALERLASSHPRSAINAHRLIERFHSNSHTLAALAQSCLELASPAGPSVSDPDEHGNDEGVELRRHVEAIRRDAVALDERLREMLRRQPAGAASVETTNMITRAVQQQELLLGLLTQLTTT